MQAFTIRGAVAVVTGAAGGIGRALALDLAGRGAALALTDRNADALAATAASCRAMGTKVSEHVFDMADASAISRCPTPWSRSTAASISSSTMPASRWRAISTRSASTISDG